MEMMTCIHKEEDILEVWILTHSLKAISPHKTDILKCVGI